MSGVLNAALRRHGAGMRPVPRGARRIGGIGLAAALAVLLLIQTVLAQSLTFPALTGPVMDEAGLLNPADKAALDTSLRALEARTGAQVVVATVRSLQGVTIEDYGYQLGRAWKIGQKDTSTGALLIVAPNDHTVRIEVGYGLEGALTDAATRLIIETVILPRFRANDYPGGIKGGVAQIAQILTADAQTGEIRPAGTPSLTTPAGEVPVWPVILMGLGFVAILIWCAIRGGALCQFFFQMLYMIAASSGRGGGGGGSSGSGSSYSGRGGSFGGGGSSGRW